MNAPADQIDRRLRKSEILRSKKTIKELFSKGSSFYIHPFRVKFLGSAAESPTQILVTVPKKLFKRAVDRNQLKRRIKEAYRLNKFLLAQNSPQRPEYLAIIYTDKEKIDFEIIQKKLILILQRLINDQGNKS